MSPRLAIGAWLVFLAACLAIVMRTHLSTDLSAFLPRVPTPAQQLLVEQLRDGVVSRLILIGIEGAAEPALAQTSKALAARLRGQPGIAAVDNGEDAGAARDREFLWRNRYLLSPAIVPGHFSATSLRAALEENLQLLGSPAGMLVQRVLPSDPTGELLRLVEQLEAQARPGVRDGVWFAPDGRRALLVVQTHAAGYDIDAQERVLMLIRSAFAGANKEAGQKLLLSGPGVFSVSSRARIKEDAWRLSVVATALVAALMLALYRSPRVLLLGFLPVASGALGGVAAVSLGFGEVHGITLGFGATLIGEGVDYAIYLFTQTTPGADPQTTLERIWPTLRLGVLTSICGFSAMLLSGFPGLAQLGLFSIAGLVVAVAVTRYVLPTLLPKGFSVRAATVLAPLAMAAARRAPVMRYPLLGVVALATGLLIAQRDAIWSPELASLSPIPLGDQVLDKQLRRDLGAPDARHLIVASATNEQSALETGEQVGEILRRARQSGLLEGFDAPGIHLPSFALQRARQAALPAPETLRENLSQALAGLPFRPGVFEPFLRDVASAREQPLLTRTSLQGTRLAVKVDSLLVDRGGSGWAAMLPLRGVTDAAGIAREFSQLPATAAVMVDLKRESDQLYQTYLGEIVDYSLLGAGVIAMLLVASLRSARRVLSVLAPLAAAVIVTAGLLVWSGAQLSIFHLVGLLLVVAVGSNYALFFEQRSDRHDWERIVASLLFANVTTVIGFGLLAFSQVPLLHAIGSTVGIGAVLSLVFSAILIPHERLAAGGASA